MQQMNSNCIPLLQPMPNMAYHKAVEEFRDEEYPMMKGKKRRVIECVINTEVYRQGLPRSRWHYHLRKVPHSILLGKDDKQSLWQPPFGI